MLLFVFINGETNAWALNLLNTLFPSKFLSNVLVTDQEIALTNAIKWELPKAKKIIVHFQIDKCVAANC